MRKKFIFVGIALVMLFSLVGLTACGQSHDIPNGDYVGAGESSSFTLSTEQKHIDWYWSIKGNNANYYSSGFHQYKCKIIEEDGELYFDGNITYGEKKLVRFKITYNNETKTLEVKCPECAQFWCQCNNN